ncbi:hypothetical protein [[Kitasatospora] papulosa]|uniref:hypothetical protein n=1 Tax=[Kitasatospora] papulosa TaxID=1464011 RepID=UPI0036CAD284
MVDLYENLYACAGNLLLSPDMIPIEDNQAYEELMRNFNSLRRQIMALGQTKFTT